jgi:hypothetical protein
LDSLYVPTAAPWYQAFRSELLSFPAGRHDDCVDALGLVGQLLDLMSNGSVPRDEVKKPDQLAYVIGHDGRVRSNMSVFDIVQAKLRRRERE